MKKPDFLIIGTQKGGTTWLEHNLSEHPDVYTPKQQIHFFDRNYEKGNQWYFDFFKDQSENKVCGEKTTEYFDTNTMDIVPERIKAVLPNVKLIVILRDPVDRAVSALRHMVNSGLVAIPKNFESDLLQEIELDTASEFGCVERGLYARQLEAYLKYFTDDQILVLILEEDIKLDPNACWKKTCDFLGLTHIPALTLNKPVNVLRLSKVSIFLSRVLIGIPFSRSVVRRIDRVLKLPKWSPVVSQETRCKLFEFYREENERLFKLIGRNVPSWGRK